MATRGGATGVSSFPSSPSCFRKNGRATSSTTLHLVSDANEVKPVEKKAPTKPKKSPEEDVIPSLKATLEAQDHITELELSFEENTLEGFFLKKGNPYSFWAFFPDGVLTGPKGCSLSSYGSGVSSIEPFLIDEKKITEKHIVFWVEKRLAAQGIIPVWRR
ncbi:hypothetical protein NC653_007217 [Populus alba x Populus x berolinensis]|uniref:Uncharacterized protein n=1 Tax=Populus alba x Populus x berolinensis TaxID=444605 RepID=A0AAD6RGV0_9ROSI|nr:hypothetical protein NC653_007217 [Populus alba x Populus x berolinensis]